MTDAERYQKNTNQEIWMLSLYKQHFLDQYAPNMGNQYSCWGYYDGLSLIPISAEPEEKSKDGDRQIPSCSYHTSRLFEKKSLASISRIWCGSMYSSMSLDGRYSKQNIGIFRCADTDNENGSGKKKKELVEKSPFFAVAFVQLKDKSRYAFWAEQIEKQTIMDSEEQTPYCILKCYNTFDNADLVVLLYSNSLGKLDYMLNWLKDQPDVNYVYSIESVSEQYLKDCEKGILSSWQGINCFVDERIAHMFLNVLTSGTSEVIPKLKTQFSDLEKDGTLQKEEFQKISFSFVQGRTDVMVDIKDIPVKAMLRMFLKDGMLTHDNPLFGKDIYNIETSLAIQEMCLSDTSETVSVPEKEDSQQVKLWFSSMAGKYKALMEQVWKEQDEGTYADYCSLVQISNALAQYEGFTLSRDLFYLLYSPFKMFYERLSAALKAVDKEKKERYGENPQISMQYIKESICEFTHGVNSVTSHTIHNNQFFLMIPGYTGTTFLIPVKLCMMYLWMAKKEIELLNDGGYKYSCLLTPGLESRPESTLINMGRNDNDRLIHFSSSQRSLYMPRHFMIILTHEMAHYVGKDIRNRRFRMNCIANTLTYYLAELVVPESMKITNPWISDDLYGQIKDRIQEVCAEMLCEKISVYKDEEQIHAKQIVKYFKQICFELVARNGKVDSTIKEVRRDLSIRNTGENLAEYATKFRVLESQLDINRERLLTSQRTIEEAIEELVQVYREVFSDMAAFCLLQCNMKEFSEAFNVSEGKLLTRDNHAADIQKRVRERIVGKVFFPEDVEMEEKEEENLLGPKNSSKNIYSFCWTGELLYNYAKKSRETIEARIENFEVKERLKEQYQMFTSEKYTCAEIYEKIMESVMEYEKEINAEYKADREQE